MNAQEARLVTNRATDTLKPHFEQTELPKLLELINQEARKGNSCISLTLKEWQLEYFTQLGYNYYELGYGMYSMFW